MRNVRMTIWMMRSKSILVGVMVVLLFGSASISFANTASFQGLGDLTGGGFSSYATDVSADGLVVVGYARNAVDRKEAFRWTAGGGMVGLGYLPGDGNSYAYGVSADGSVIVGYKGVEAFRWTSGTGMVGLGDLPEGDFKSYAEDVSADGSVVVGRGQSTLSTEAFR